VQPDSIYACEKSPEFQQAILATAPDNEKSREYLTGVGQIVWTKSMKRLYTLVGRCLQHKEPVLLVGETGSSKTTICQVFAAALQRKLTILNCHQHTETADFLGGLRPVRGMSIYS
jgi:midasin